MIGWIGRPRFGERVVSWQNVWNELYPDDADDPHDDSAAEDMNRLRGLIMAQAAELESALGALVRQVSPDAPIERWTAGKLAKEVRSLLTHNNFGSHNSELQIIEQAIGRRNHAVHSPVTIGSVWRDFASGGGEWVSVISFMGDGEYDEARLIEDLALMQEALIAAVRLLHAFQRPIV